MSAPSTPLHNPRLLILVIGVVLLVVASVLSIVALTPSSSSGSTSPPPTHRPPSTASCSPPPPAGGPTIVNCTAAVSASRPVETSALSAPAGSLVLVFIGFVGASGGGGGPDLITDSVSDPFTFIAGAGLNQTPIEELYAADVRVADADLTVSVFFGGGSASQGGSVAVVDVANAALGSIGAFVTSTGTGPTASLALTDSAPGDLNLLGVAGPGSSGPYTSVGGETLLDTGNATSGPLGDSVGYGTFAIERNATSASELSAGLHAPGLWDAIGVSLSLGSPFLPPPLASTCAGPFPPGQPSVYTCAGAVSNASPVTTVAIPTESDSLVLVFVSYVNSEAGGPTSISISDSNGDTYTLLNSTGLSLNHTEELFATQVGVPPDLAVAVNFSGGATPAGGSVAVIDIANASLTSVDSSAWNTGLHGSANVTLTTRHTGDLFLLGTAGRGVSGPYSPGPGETLLDTGSADSGPFEDGTGYGTFAMFSAETTVTLRANPNYPTFWDAIGVAIDP